MKDFNELVDELKEIANSLEKSVHAKFVSITDRIDELESKINNLSRDVDSSLDNMEDNVEELDGRVDELESDMHDCRNEISTTNNKVYTLEDDLSDAILTRGE